MSPEPIKECDEIRLFIYFYENPLVQGTYEEYCDLLVILSKLVIYRERLVRLDFKFGEFKSE